MFRGIRGRRGRSRSSSSVLPGYLHDPVTGQILHRGLLIIDQPGLSWDNLNPAIDVNAPQPAAGGGAPPHGNLPDDFDYNYYGDPDDFDALPGPYRGQSDDPLREVELLTRPALPAPDDEVYDEQEYNEDAEYEDGGDYVEDDDDDVPSPPGIGAGGFTPPRPRPPAPPRPGSIPFDSPRIPIDQGWSSRGWGQPQPEEDEALEFDGFDPVLGTMTLENFEERRALGLLVLLGDAFGEVSDRVMAGCLPNFPWFHWALVLLALPALYLVDPSRFPLTGPLFLVLGGLWAKAFSDLQIVFAGGRNALFAGPIDPDMPFNTAWFVGGTLACIPIWIAVLIAPHVEGTYPALFFSTLVPLLIWGGREEDKKKRQAAAGAGNPYSDFVEPGPYGSATLGTPRDAARGLRGGRSAHPFFEE